MSGVSSPSFRNLGFIFSFSLLMVCVGCAGGSTSGPTPAPTATPIPTPTPTPTPVPFAGVSLKVGDATVPRNGIFQYQLLLTEPKPIGNGSTRPSTPTGPVGPVRGVAINDVSGQAVGIAVINGSSISVSAKSPTGTFGTDISYPLFTLTMPVNATATPGATFPVDLDNASALFTDPTGVSYIKEIAGGTLTIAADGKQSITDVIPGGGLLPDRTMLRVLGLNFTNNTRISIEGTTVFFPADTTFVNSNEIDVVICNGAAAETATSCPNTGEKFQLDGERVRATNKDTNDVVEYFSYNRTTDDTSALPATGNALVAQVHPMFSRVTYAAGTIPFTHAGTQFTGIAFQNITAGPSTVKVELLDAGNASLSSASFTLPNGKRLARDIADFFPAPPAGAVTVRATVTGGSPIQMLGMLGDTSTGAVTPVVVTAQ